MSSRVEHKHIKVMNATRDLLPAHNAEIAIFTTIAMNQRCSRANNDRGSAVTSRALIHAVAYSTIEHDWNQSNLKKRMKRLHVKGSWWMGGCTAYVYVYVYVYPSTENNGKYCGVGGMK